jgi:hypothetical protein
MMRVTAYLGVLLGLALLFAVHMASAEVSKASLELGRDMLPLADLVADHARVSINGEHIWASSAITPASVSQLLDRFEANCRSSGADGVTWGDLSSSQTASLSKAIDMREPGHPSFNFGVFRSEKGNEGAILCFPHGGGASGADSLAKMKTFMQTKDLGSFGRLRYAFIRRERDTSHVLTMWTDEHLHIDRLAGIDGSEPGFDSPDLPRPIRARRTVSASVDGTPYVTYGYLSAAKPADVLSSYGGEMARQGWQTAPTTDQNVRGYAKDGAVVTIGVESRTEGTLVGITEMGSD